MLKKSLAIIKHHKFWSTLILIILISLGYFGYNYFLEPKVGTTYLTKEVRVGTFIRTISGSGQVSASNQLILKPKASGEILNVIISAGSVVESGAIIAIIDSRDAEKAVRDARNNLASAEISLKKLQLPPDKLSLTQAENALINAKQAKEKSESDLIKSYDDGFNTVANAFLDLPQLMTDLNNILYGSNVNSGQTNLDAYNDIIKNYKANSEIYKDSAKKSFDDAKKAFDINLANYKASSRYSERETVDDLIKETYELTKSISEAIKNSKNYLDLVNDVYVESNKTKIPPSALTIQRNSLESFTGTTNNHLGN